MIANGSNTIRRALLGSALVLGLVLPACDILDVNNPNSVKEEDLGKISAAAALVNGAVAANWRAAANVWLGYLMATDEIVWIGSRDSWGQLDQGFIANPANEFTNAAYPLLGQARWMADRAASQLDAHVDSVPTPAMKTQQARAYLMAGMIYALVGEVQEDFVLGDKQEADPPLGPTKMSVILDQAIQKLDKALTIATEVNNDSLITRTLAMRARAKHSRALWDKIKPTIAAQPLVSSAGASADAAAVLARASVNASWRFQMTFSSASLNNFMASEINSRGEQQFDTTSVVQVNKAAPKTILSVKLMDPIENKPDPRIVAFLQEWKSSPNIGVAGDVYAPLTIVSAKHMRLILAEDELAKGNTAGFTTHINAVRAVDGLAPYSGQIPALDMLKHERRAALFVTGVRLMDMYRFGIRDPLWHVNSDTRNKPGMLLPITCRELDANPHLTPC